MLYSTAAIKKLERIDHQEIRKEATHIDFVEVVLLLLLYVPVKKHKIIVGERTVERLTDTI